jgi:hypothetical protein
VADEPTENYSNYETKMADIMLGNDQETEWLWRTRADQIFEDAEAEGVITRRERAIFTLADEMDDWYQVLVDAASNALSPFLFTLLQGGFDNGE